MADDIAIRVGGLGKKYVIGGAQEQYDAFRDAIVNIVAALHLMFLDRPPPGTLHNRVLLRIERTYSYVNIQILH
ncbi:MAG: hypothetical protein Q7V05_14750 [Methanoregula sp.]|nr:hypothetical protein [Methanoregula sp.]